MNILRGPSDEETMEQIKSPFLREKLIELVNRIKISPIRKCAIYETIFVIDQLESSPFDCIPLHDSFKQDLLTTGTSRPHLTQFGKWVHVTLKELGYNVKTASTIENRGGLNGNKKVISRLGELVNMETSEVVFKGRLQDCFIAMSKIADSYGDEFFIR